MTNSRVCVPPPSPAWISPKACWVNVTCNTMSPVAIPDLLMVAFTSPTFIVFPLSGFTCVLFDLMKL